MPRLRSRKSPKSSGFTIVELLVVIVVIGVLAAITIVAYTGISQKAVASSLQSDLTNASTQLKMFQVENSDYPTANNCQTPSATEICLKFSPGNTFVGYSANNQSASKTFLLIANNGSLAYKVTNDLAPTQLASTMQTSVTPGAILELHAAKANSGTNPGINAPLTTTWKDTSGSGNNGTLTNFSGTPWQGVGTLADPHRLIFDGIDDHVDAPLINASGTKVFTYEAWFRTTDTRALQAPIVGESNWGISGIQSRMVLYVGLLYGQMMDATYTSVVAGGSAFVADGAWHHGAVVSDGSWMTVYVDGVASAGVVAVLASNMNITSTTSPTQLGTTQTAGGLFQGSIAAARIYPFALTVAQVATNYAAGPDW